MTREEVDSLIQRLGAQAQTSPRAFLVRVGGYALFGYAYMLGVLALMIALTLLVVGLVIAAPNALTIKLGLVVGAAAGGMALILIRSLWVQLLPPTGLVLTAADAPALFTLVDEVRRALDAPALQQVLLMADYNAGVVQTPRLGILGWHRNFLLIGLPLLQSLGRDEFRAVLAHEFGHLSRAHGRFGNWLYRLRRSWERIFQELFRHRPSKLAFLLTRFVGWFWPRFNAHAFVLGRANEYEADAAAARLAGRATLARALIRIQVDARLLQERFWPSIFLRANHEPAPPSNVFGEQADALRAGPAPADAERWQRASFLLETNNADTHPCLKDRLRALGELPADMGTRMPAALPPPAEPVAAEALLQLQTQLSQAWAASVAADWQRRYAEAQQLQQRLAALEAKPAAHPMEPMAEPAAGSVVPASVAVLWERAKVQLELEGDAAAVPAVEQILAQYPAHPEACFVRGRHFLATDDPRGVDLVERAIAGNPQLTRVGCNLLYGHFARTGQRDRLRPLEERVEHVSEVEAVARRERAEIRVTDHFIPHLLSAESRAQLQAVFAREPAIATVHVARKAVVHFPERPCFVVAISVPCPWWKPGTPRENQAIVGRVLRGLELPGDRAVFVRDGPLESLGCEIAEVADSLVYQNAHR